jgi:hypothetical protein
VKLILTHYIATDPAVATTRLPSAVSRALDSAAERVAANRDDTMTATLVDGISVQHGLGALDGTELHLCGIEHLTELRIEVPWVRTDSGTSKLWAANRFAGVVADELTGAA